MADKYKPFIAHKKEYIKKVAESIVAKPALEQIPFHLLTDVLQALGINKSPYDFVKADSFESKKIEELAHESFFKIGLSSSQDLREKLYKLWDYLSENDDLQKADLIFVFGSAVEDSAHTAAELYKESFAPKIMFTGHSAIYQEHVGMAEAEHFAQIAENEGVPRNVMLLETESRNTPENVINGLRILKSTHLQPQTIILITFSYHMRRAYLTFRAVLDWNAKLIRRTSVSKSKRDNFFFEEKPWTAVFFEFTKLYGGRVMQHF